ncbi:hypothetical protein [Acidovorax sp. NB1]|uniref:hypothetical protein n=1 Tax=Acidovorax sp. NB1 TaxID=1943571 RepID=UPI0010D843B9|nr:hypothetical protein [Acidovorax sp. NB1]GDY37251.1 hypothetical protein ACINB_31430 [Acidovorax sp. NB1]
MTQTLPWFRAYTKMVDDEKLRLLAFEDRWHFIAILCLKGQGVLDANDPLMMRKAAVKMGLDLRSLEEVARRLAEVGLIEQATLQPIKWETLQQRSDADPTATERKQRQRQRERDAAEALKKANGEARVAAHGEDANATDQTGVTAESRVTVTDASRVTGHEVTRTDIDKEGDTDKEDLLTTPPSVGAQNSEAAPSASPAEPTAPEGKSRNGKRLPEDWKLPKKWGDWALQEFTVLTDAEVRAQAATFADYWHAKAGKDARKLDWEAVWRNWIRRHMEQRGRGASASRAPDPETPTETYAQRAARQRMEEVAPGVARKTPAAESGFEAAQRFIAGGAVIDVQARDAAPRIEGAAA